MNNERKPGYYRVKLLGNWIILFWFINKERMFWIAANAQMYDDIDLDEIIETPISPEPDEEKERTKEVAWEAWKVSYSLMAFNANSVSDSYLRVGFERWYSETIERRQNE